VEDGGVEVRLQAHRVVGGRERVILAESQFVELSRARA
jgi:hypothetical protein